jgi:hypothetical protein
MENPCLLVVMEIDRLSIPLTPPTTIELQPTSSPASPALNLNIIGWWGLFTKNESRRYFLLVLWCLLESTKLV